MGLVGKQIGDGHVDVGSVGQKIGDGHVDVV